MRLRRAGTTIGTMSRCDTVTCSYVWNRQGGNGKLKQMNKIGKEEHSLQFVLAKRNNA